MGTNTEDIIPVQQVNTNTMSISTLSLIDDQWQEEHLSLENEYEKALVNDFAELKLPDWVVKTEEIEIDLIKKKK